MNQAQRKFLIDKVEATCKARISALKSQEAVQPPSLENYFYGLALSGKLEIQSQEHIKAVMCERALKHTSQRYSETWLGTSQGDLMGRALVKIPIKDLLVVPAEYDRLWEDYRAKRAEDEERIRQIEVEMNTLTMRIQLASDKTLERMIAEIDDMGDISLMDNKLKHLINGGISKMLE